MYINSIKNPFVIEARELARSAERVLQNKCLLESKAAIEWALLGGCIIEHVFYCEKEFNQSFISWLESQSIYCHLTSEGVMKKITDTSYLIPLVAIARMPKSMFYDQYGDFGVLMDHVVDHGNIGTIVRTAQAFGVKDFIVTEQTFDWTYKKTIDASRGTIFSARLHRFGNALEAINILKSRGFQIVATSPHAQHIQGNIELKKKPTVLVIGNETKGVSDEVLRNSDVVVQIPMTAAVESLNVAVAAGISLYELKLKMVIAMLKHYIFENIGRQINVTGKLIQMVFDERISKITGLSGTQVILLMVLKCDEVSSMEQIAQDTGFFGKALDELLEPLLQKKYIQQLQHGIVLTPTGEGFLANIWTNVELISQEVLHGFLPEEQQQLQNFLKRIEANCEQILCEDAKCIK